MAEASEYPVVIYRSWFDEAHTRPVWVAEVLFASKGPSCLGQGRTPNIAEKDARDGLAFMLEDAETRRICLPARDGDVMMTLEDGQVQVSHIHPAGKEK